MNLLIILLSVSAVFADSTCIDTKVDQKVAASAVKKAASVLNPANKKAVPAGLPAGDYPNREAEIIATSKGTALVAIYFAQKGEKAKNGFMVPFIFNGDLTSIYVSDLGNGDSRFWDVKFKISDLCKSPQVQITFDSCMGCGNGNDLTGNFALEKDSSWSFIAHQ